MRPTAQERSNAEHTLETTGWTVVKINKPPISHTQNIAHIPMVRWCEGNIGAGRIEPNFEKGQWLDGNDVWYMFTWYGYWKFHFKNEKDATAFVMRWM